MSESEVLHHTAHDLRRKLIRKDTVRQAEIIGLKLFSARTVYKFYPQGSRRKYR